MNAGVPKSIRRRFCVVMEVQGSTNVVPSNKWRLLLWWAVHQVASSYLRSGSTRIQRNSWTTEFRISTFKNNMPLNFFQHSGISITNIGKIWYCHDTVHQFLHVSYHCLVAKNHQDTIVGTGIQYPDPSARTSGEGMLLSSVFQKKTLLVEDNLPFRERSHIPPWEKEHHLQKYLWVGDMLVPRRVCQSYFFIRILTRRNKQMWFSDRYCAMVIRNNCTSVVIISLQVPAAHCLFDMKNR